MDRDDEELRNFIMEKGILGITETNLESKIRMIMSRRTIGEKEVALVVQFLSAQKKIATHDMIMEILKNSLGHINWLHVFAYMDHPKFFIETNNLLNMIDLWKSMNKDNNFPYHSFFKRWKNTKSQINFINIIIECDEINNISNNVFLTRILKEDKERRFVNTECNFNCVELFSLIRELNYVAGIKKIYQKSSQWCLIGLILITPYSNDLFRSYLLPKIQENDQVLSILFNINKGILINHISNSNLELSKIHNICVTQKMFPYIADSLTPPFFSFEIIFLSCRKKLIDLNLFISNALNSKKDAAANVLINYFLEKFKQVERGIVKEDIRRENEYYPLNYELILTAIQCLEQHIKQYNRETVSAFNKFKNTLPTEIKSMIDKKSNYENEANNFLGTIISGNRTVSEGISAINRYKDKNFVMKIYSVLIDNYTNFQQIPNKKEIATLYGKLLENNVLPTFYAKRLLNNIYISLRNNEETREYEFALRILEIFSDNIDKYPKFKADVEKIDSVKEFINEKKNIYVLEEALLTDVGIYEILDIIIPIDSVNLKDSVKWEEVNNIVSNENLENKTIYFNDQLVIRGILEDRIMVENPESLVKIIFGLNIYDSFLKSTFELINLMLTFKFAEENIYMKKLGILIGKLTIGLDKLFTFHLFDVKEFFVKAIKARRSRFYVYFIIGFLIGGEDSQIFRPKNPYIMRLLFMLSEVMEYSGQTVKNDIESFLNATLNIKEIREYDKNEKLRNIIKEYTTLDASKVSYLSNYRITIGEKVELEQILRYIIGMAIDFSIKEITFIIEEKIKGITMGSTEKILQCKNITEKILGTQNFHKKIDMLAENIEKAGKATFNNIEGDLNSLQTIFRINLIRSLVHVSAHEPIRASICGNIAHFIKLANLTLDTNYIQKIAEENIEICCDIITRHTVRIFDNNQPIDYTNPYISSISLFDPVNYKKLALEPLKFTEYNEIKERLIQISKKNPRKSVVHIKNEWELIEQKLDNECIPYDQLIDDINNLLTYIKESSTSDNLAELLSKKVISYILRKNCINLEYMMYTLSEIFKFSFKAQTSVISWVVYSKDEKKFNVTLISSFINYNLINISELDSNLSKLLKSDKYLSFALILLRKLIFEYYCSPYDFIKSIEALCLVNEQKFDVRIYNILKVVSDMVIEGKPNITLEKYLHYFNTLIPESPIVFTREFVNTLLNGSWDFFLKNYRSTSLYAFNAIDHFSIILSKKEYITTGIDVFTDFLVQAIEKGNFTFQKIYARFIYNIMKLNSLYFINMERTEENTEIDEMKGLAFIGATQEIISKEEQYHLLRDCYYTQQLLCYNNKPIKKEINKKNPEESDTLTTIQPEDYKNILFLRNNSKEDLVIKNLSEYFISEPSFKNLLSELLLTITPKNIPSFTASYINLCTNELVFSLNEKTLFLISKEILFVLKYLDHKDNILIGNIIRFFACLKKHNSSFIYNYSIYLSFYTYSKFHYLKNVFNRDKRKLDKNKDSLRKEKLGKKII
ncbi:Not1 negative regulator of transcription, partial [Spraguea lophii 42_110]